jgi:hypothetical protein
MTSANTAGEVSAARLTSDPYIWCGFCDKHHFPPGHGTARQDGQEPAEVTVP